MLTHCPMAPQTSWHTVTPKSSEKHTDQQVDGTAGCPTKAMACTSTQLPTHSGATATEKVFPSPQGVSTQPVPGWPTPLPGSCLSSLPCSQAFPTRLPDGPIQRNTCSVPGEPARCLHQLHSSPLTIPISEEPALNSSLYLASFPYNGRKVSLCS